MDVNGGLKKGGVNFPQELIIDLRWSVEDGRIDILLEISLISTHFALTHEVNIEQVLQIFGYPNIHKKIRLMFDCGYPRIIHRIFKEYDWFDFYRYSKEAIRPNIPESRGYKVSIYTSVDNDLAGDKSSMLI